MPPNRTKLLRCFSAVFPGYEEHGLLAATPDLIERWDSSHHVLLLNVIEEEFGLVIPEEVGGELLSFMEFEAYLQSRLSPK